MGFVCYYFRVIFLYFLLGLASGFCCAGYLGGLGLWCLDCFLLCFGLFVVSGCYLGLGWYFIFVGCYLDNWVIIRVLWAIIWVLGLLFGYYGLLFGCLNDYWVLFDLSFVLLFIYLA